MPDNAVLVLIGLVFLAVFLLSQGMIVPVFGEGRKARKRLRQRLSDIENTSGTDALSSLLREKYLRKLSPLERTLEGLPGMERLSRLIEQSGSQLLAYRLVLASIVIAVVAAIAVWVFTRLPLYALAAFAVGAFAPYFKIMRDRTQRFARFEEQLPDAIDVIRRAVMAGHPFNAALKLVSEDMPDPVGREFDLTFADINYGNDVRRAMLGLLSRLPSVTVMAFVTAVLVQKETGGNLAEILNQISAVIRARFRFQRRVRTLSAEGRMSAWVLVLIPFVMFVAISIMNPDYLPLLLENPTGRQLLAGAVVWTMIGIVWIRKIIRIEV